MRSTLTCVSLSHLALACSLLLLRTLNSARGCAPLGGNRNPNFLLLDFVNQGDAFRAADVLNGLAWIYIFLADGVCPRYGKKLGIQDERLRRLCNAFSVKLHSRTDALPLTKCYPLLDSISKPEIYLICIQVTRYILTKSAWGVTHPETSRFGSIVNLIVPRSESTTVANMSFSDFIDRGYSLSM